MCKTINELSRKCIICDKTIEGRSDKVFCDIKCKNNYHSEIRKLKNQVSFDTMEIMTKNWVILEGLMQEKNNKLIVKKIILEKLRFNFNYTTGVKNRHSHFEYQLFNFKYTFTKNNTVYIQKDKEPSDLKSSYLFKRWERKLEIKNIKLYNQ